MSDETNNKSEGGGLDRRNFLKSAGVIVTGSTLGAGISLAPETAAAAQVVESVPTTITQFRCPVCGKNSGSYADLQHHFNTEHPDADDHYSAARFQQDARKRGPVQQQVVGPF